MNRFIDILNIVLSSPLESCFVVIIVDFDC